MKKREIKIRFLEHENDHVGFAHGFNVGWKKAVNTIFLKNFYWKILNLSGSWSGWIETISNFLLRNYGTIYTRKTPKCVKV